MSVEAGSRVVEADLGHQDATSPAMPVPKSGVITLGGSSRGGEQDGSSILTLLVPSPVRSLVWPQGFSVEPGIMDDLKYAYSGE